MSHYYYDSESGSFFKVISSRSGLDITEEVGSFEDLMRAVRGNLSVVDFNDFDFGRVDVSVLNLKGAKIPAEIQMKLGIFDDTFYRENITDVGDDDLSLDETPPN